jgi:acetylglutamate kinase
VVKKGLLAAMLVLKVGGNEIDDNAFLSGLAHAVARMAEVPVIVHGGGKEIADLQVKLGVKPQFIEGLRVTDETSLAIAEMVLSGRVNKRVVAALVHVGVDAIGLSGIDRGIVRAERIRHPAGNLGRVGRVAEVRADVLFDLLARRIVPVISPISLGEDGAYNVNADSVACAIARAMHADALVFVTNVAGVMEGDRLIESLTADQTEALIASHVIQGGMIPKVRAALDAISGGARAARITNLDGVNTGRGTLFMTERT